MNTIITIIIIALSIAVGMLLDHFLPSYFKRKGENKADKEDATDLAYLEEKGKNLATKEDIAELTKTIESVKQEVSFANQRQHNIIETRNKCLFELLECAASIENNKGLLLIYSKNISMRDSIVELLHNTNKAIRTAISHSNYIITTYQSTVDLSVVASYADAIRLHGVEIETLLINTISMIDNFNNQYELFKQSKDKNCFVVGMAIKNELFNESRYTQWEYAENLKKKEHEYMVFLRNLYRTDNILKYKE